LAHNHFFHLGDKDGVISSVLGGMQPALQVSEGSAQNRRAMLGTLKASARYLGRTLVRARSARIVFRDDSLIFPENVYPETFSGV